MIRIGIIGIGFMGYTHFEGARKLKGAKVTAIATRNAKKLAGDWTAIQGNFGPRGGHVDLSKIKTEQIITMPGIVKFLSNSAVGDSLINLSHVTIKCYTTLSQSGTKAKPIAR